MNSANSSSAAPSFAAATSASVFQSLGIFQNNTSTHLVVSLLISFIRSSHRSRFLTGTFFEVIQFFRTHAVTHSVAPLIAYSESVAMTMRFQPSACQFRNCKAAMAARSSARLLVCSAGDPFGDLPSKRNDTVPYLTCGEASESRGGNTKPHPAFGLGRPLLRQAPAVKMRISLGFVFRTKRVCLAVRMNSTFLVSPCPC